MKKKFNKNNNDKPTNPDPKNKNNEFSERYFKDREPRKPIIRSDHLKPKGFINDSLKKKND